MSDRAVNRKKVLIVDDEEHIVQMLEMNMRTQGYESLCAYSGEECLALAVSESPDVILLDVMMPGMDGIEACRQLKANPATLHIPVIMVSAKSEEADRIHGLQGGADDYITKPFSLQELFLRIRAALRQVEVLTSVNRGGYSAGSLLLDTQKYQVTSNGERIDLTLTEFRILHMLLKHKGEVVLRNTMIQEIFEKNPSDMGRTIDVHVRNIRKKLRQAGVEGCMIETIRGMGYRI